jgi:hypothetical protein
MAVAAPVVVGVTALAIDTGVLGVSRGQLQTAADAAALAGAAALQQRIVTQADVTAAGASAVAFAAKNSVLGDAAALEANPTNSNDGTRDLVVGRIDPTDAAQVLRTDSSKLPYFNAVEVRATRSASRGGAIPTFFFGNAGTDMSVSSTAAVMTMSGFQRGDGSTSVNCLPIVLDQTTATNMFNGATTDLYSYNSASNSVSSGSDGVTESRAYPVSNGSPGNWGTVKIGVNNNSTSTLKSQISGGITPSQMATFADGVFKLDGTGSLVLDGNPGISAGIKGALTDIIGQPRWMPVYDPNRSGGNGNNAYYTIVTFVPIRVMAVNFSGSNKYVVVQPATIPRTDPTLYWSIRPATSVPTAYKLRLVR